MITEQKMHCARHSNVETALTCGSCGAPICPRCMVSTPVGMKCRDCGTSRGSVLFQVKPQRFFLAGVTALVAGLVAGLIGDYASFFFIFIAAAYGYFAGSMILRASGMKRGLKLEALAGACMVVGGLAYKLYPPLPLFKGGHVAGAGMGALMDPFYWIILVISTACAVSKIRYI